MKYLTRALTLTRLLALRRQWKTVQARLFRLAGEDEVRLAAWVFIEAAHAAKHPMPQFYGSEQVEAYRPWTDAADRAFRDVLDVDPRWSLKGIARWLTVVTHETRNACVPAMQRLHRDVAHEFERLRALHERILAVRRVRAA